MLLANRHVHEQARNRASCDQPYYVLVLCTGNSARSIMAEALFKAFGGPWFRAWSAGSQPVGRVNPLALELIETIHPDTSCFRSKSWLEFESDHSPDISFVITVCDNAANEPCPCFPGNPAHIHWGLPDPANAELPLDVQRENFHACFGILKKRIMALAAQSFAGMEKQQVADIIKAQSERR